MTMKVLGMEMSAYFVGINVLTLIDIFLITIAIIFSIPADIAIDIQIFDFIVCLILLADWKMNFYLSNTITIFL